MDWTRAVNFELLISIPCEKYILHCSLIHTHIQYMHSNTFLFYSSPFFPTADCDPLNSLHNSLQFEKH